jgi:hypothetical protein
MSAGLSVHLMLIVYAAVNDGNADACAIESDAGNQ